MTPGSVVGRGMLVSLWVSFKHQLSEVLTRKEVLLETLYKDGMAKGCRLMIGDHQNERLVRSEMLIQYISLLLICLQIQNYIHNEKTNFSHSMQHLDNQVLHDSAS